MLSKPLVRSTSTSRRTLRGWLLRGAALLALLVGVGMLLPPPHLWRRGWNAPELPPGRSSPIVPTVEGRPTKRQTPATLTPPQIAAAQNSLVSLEADGPSGLRGIGTGFVIDASGLVATSLHVSAEMTSGVARFRDGSVFEISGYRAIDPIHDLAILELRKPPSGLIPLSLSAEINPRPFTEVVALGHPQGVGFAIFDGKLSRILPTSELSTGSQRFVRDLTGTDTNQTWVQHTAQLSDGNSGGPLLLADGQVLGINTWVDSQSGYSYAIHASALASLQQQLLPMLEPLASYATPTARRKNLLWQISAQRLQELHQQAVAMRWSPENRAEYAVLQQIAVAVTLSQRPELFGRSDQQVKAVDELAREADRIVAELKQQKWQDIGQITLVNEFAEAELLRPVAGQFLFATVLRSVEGKGQKALLLKLAGFDQTILVPWGETLDPPADGSQVLLLGVNDQGKTIPYGDNPLAPHLAPVLTAPTLIRLEL